MSTVSFPTIYTGRYDLDPSKTRIGFAVRSGITKVRGSFTRFSGAGYLDAEHLDLSHLAVSIETASLDTRNERRDDHLRSRAFLDADTHPEITFVSTGVDASGDGRFQVRGDLTIRSVTRPLAVTLTSRTAVGSATREHIEFEGSAHLRRADWGVTWNPVFEGGGFLISPTVALELWISAVRSAPS